MKFNEKDLEELAAIRHMRSLSEADGVIMLPAKDLKMLIETLDLFCDEMDRICGLEIPEVEKGTLN
jgi:hypothetical protein